MPFKTSVIIPTYNRPLELQNCIRSILEQTLKPDELFIVDDGDLVEFPFKKELEAADIGCFYLKKAVPGLTASRNEGIKSAGGDIIFFFDDDVVLEPDYIKEIIKVYRKDTDDSIGGVGGLQSNRYLSKFKNYLLWFAESLFLVNGIREGRVLPSGFCVDFGTTPFPIKKDSYVDFLAGCAMSFRRNVFQEFQFDSKQYLGYGLGEDKDFSFRVSRKYRLIVNPHAKLLHLESPKMRSNKKAMGQGYVIANYLFFSNYSGKSLVSRFLFYYAIFGYLITRSLMAVLSPNKENFARISGIIEGIKYIFSNRRLVV